MAILRARLLLSRTDHSICVNNPEPHFAADKTDPPTTRAMENCAPAVFAECIGGFRVKRVSLQAKRAFAGTDRHTTDTTRTREQALPALFKPRRALKIARNSCQIGEDGKDVDI